MAIGLRQAIARAEEHALLAAGDKSIGVLVAISGGPDSTSLLYALHMVASQHGFDLRACHVNHNLRGDESDQDQQFCIDLCQKLGIGLTVCADSDSRQGHTGEDLLRRKRYDLLVASAREQGLPCIATGHTLDDQAETVLFRIFRGTSLPGLCGMKQARALDDGVVIVRPMLLISREECTQFLNTIAVEARQDSSNSDDHYARNFIRRQVLPLIDSRFCGVRERVERLRNIAEDEEEWLKHLVDEATASLDQDTGDCWLIERFNALPVALKRRVVAHALQSRQIEVSFERVEAILKVASGAGENAISLNARWDFALNQSGKAAIWRDREEDYPAREFSEFRVKVPGTTLVPLLGKALQVESWTGRRVVYPAAEALSAIVNLSSIQQPLFVRSRQEGDVIQPFGMSESVKLKKYLHTHKAKGKQARSLRNVVLCNADEVLWVPGTGLSEKLRVKGSPSHRMVWLDLADDVTIA